MQTFSKKIQPLILAFVFVAVTAGILTWMSYAVVKFGDSLQDTLQTIANEKEFNDQYHALIRIVEESKDQRTDLEKYILNDDADTIALLSKLDNIAAQQGVELTTNQLAVNETAGANNFNELALGYSMSGSESAVKKMINILETLPYHGDIESFTFSRSTRDSETQITEVNSTVLLKLSIRKYD